MEDGRIRLVALVQVGLMVSALVLGAMGGAGAGSDPIYLYGDQVTVKVYPTGSFLINPMDFTTRFYDTSSSFWSFNIDGKVMNTYDPLTMDKVVTPVRRTVDGQVKVQYIFQKDVLVDVTYKDIGPAAEMTVTMINMGQSSRTVGVRHLYDVQGKLISPSGEPPVDTEKAYLDPSFSKIDLYEGAQRLGVVAIGDSNFADPPDRVIFGHWENTRATSWDYKVNQSKELGDDPTILLFWEDRVLPAGGAIRISHFFGSDVPSYAQWNDEFIMDSMTADPTETFIGKTRTVKATVRSQGTTARTIEVNFIITDDLGYYIANGSVAKTIGPSETREFAWSYAVKKVAETRAIAIVDPSGDVTPGNNYMAASIKATPSPYRVKLEFEDGTRIDYIDIESGKKAKSTVIVKNTGTAEDTISMSTSTLPDKWSGIFNRSEIFLRPGESASIAVTVKTSSDNLYYNYGIDVIGRSKNGGNSDKVLLFISFSDVISKGGGTSNISGNSTPVDPKDPDPKPTPPPDPTPDPVDTGFKINKVQFGIAIIVFAALMIGIVAIYQIYLLGSKMSMKGILEDLYRKLYSVDDADAYRKAIFKAYKQMCEELAKYGHGREESITPKEFEKEIRKHLPIDRKNLHVLTKLFEEARYSRHKFTEKKKRRALKALKGIIHSLGDVTTFEEVKEGGWFKKST